MRIDQEETFSINALREQSLSELPKISTIYIHSHKASNLFQSLISTNIIDKSPFDLEPYRDSAADSQYEEIDLLKLEEMIPNLSIKRKPEPDLPIFRRKTTDKKKENPSISQKSEEDDSEYEALNRRKHKKPNRSVQGSTNNMLVIFKGMIKSYLRREDPEKVNQFFPKGYLNLKWLHYLITSSPLRTVLARMLEERYLQRAVVTSSISLHHKMLYLKKLKKIMKRSASSSDP